MNNFLNRALSHTFVKMTWDEPQLNRFEIREKDGVKGEFDDNIVEQYLASDVEKISGEGSDSNNDNDDDDNSDDDVW